MLVKEPGAAAGGGGVSRGLETSGTWPAEAPPKVPNNCVKLPGSFFGGGIGSDAGLAVTGAAPNPGKLD